MMAEGRTPPEQFPAYPHEQQLEDRSLNELRLLLGETFVVRDQRSRDFGVDVTLEVVLDGRATNYTAAVQVKARSGLTPNHDGSLSLPIRSSNIDYLLSAAMSLVVLYDADRRAFYYVRVLDEIRRLESEGVAFRSQDSITLRLCAPLTSTSSIALRDAMLHEGRAARQVRIQLAGMSTTDLLHLNATGEGVTTVEIEREFFTRGWRLAACGELAELQRIFGLLSAANRATARAQLLMAHAHACCGRMIAAWMYASNARRSADTLAPDDIDLLELIEIGCDHVFRRCTDQDVLDRARVIRGRARTEMRMQLDVSSLRQEMTVSGDPNLFPDFARRASILAAQSSAALGPRHPATLAARVLVQDLSGRALGVAYARLQLTAQYGDGPMGLRMRGGHSAKAAVDAMSQALKEWFAQNKAARAECGEWPLFDLELEKGDLLMQIVLLRNTRLMTVGDGMERPLDLSQAPVAALLAAITSLRDRASRLGVDDVELHARLLRAELLDLADEIDGMRAEARDLLGRARACGFDRIESEARSYLEGRSMFRVAQAQMTADRACASDEDFVARATPEQRDQIAANLGELLQLPRKNREVLRDEIDRVGAVYQLQHALCRHFEIAIWEDASVRDAEYRRRPACICVCERRRVRTLLGSPHWSALVAEFRRNYCDGCTLHEPL